MDSVSKITFSKLIQYCSLFFLLCYIFFWDTKFIQSRIVLIVLLALCIMNIVLHKKIFISTPAKGWLAVLLCTLLGVAGSGESYATRICLQLFICFAIFLAFSFGELSYKTIVRLFIILCSFYCAGLFLHTINPHFVDTINESILASAAYSSYQELSSYSYYTGFSGFNCMSALFAALLSGIYLSKLFFEKKLLLKKCVYVGIILIGIIATIIAQKRGVFIACATAIIIMLLITFANKKNAKKFLVAILLLAIFMVSIYYFLQTNASGEQFLRRFMESDDISSGRFDIYLSLLSESKNTFVFGKGTGASQALFNMGAHNIYLQVYFDHGMIGLFVYLFWFVFNLIYTVKLFKNNTNIAIVRQMLFISLYVQVLFLVYGFFGNPINDIYIFLLYIFFIAMPCAIQKDILKQQSAIGDYGK